MVSDGELKRLRGAIRRKIDGVRPRDMGSGFRGN
jgi:hypothetical protein